MHIKVSIIIPVYNISAYISQCLDSILQQNFDGFEIVIVNDGSTDNSLNIIREYMQHFTDKISIVNQENAGVSKARNTGIEHSRGEYLLFVDGDDWLLDKYMLNECYSIIEKNELDILCYNAKLCYSDSNTKTLKRNEALISAYPMSGERFYELSVKYNSLQGEACFNIYRKHLLSTSAIRFNDRLYIGEDQVFTTKCFLKATKVMYIDKAYYAYRQRNGSAMRSGQWHGKIENLLESLDEIFIEYLQSEGKTKDALAKRMQWLYLSIFKQVTFNKTDRIFFGRIFKQHISDRLSLFKRNLFDEIIYRCLCFDSLVGFLITSLAARAYSKWKV